jgi:hypothetical protein
LYPIYECLQEHIQKYLDDNFQLTEVLNIVLSGEGDLVIWNHRDALFHCRCNPAMNAVIFETALEELENSAVGKNTVDWPPIEPFSLVEYRGK